MFYPYNPLVREISEQVAVTESHLVHYQANHLVLAQSWAGMYVMSGTDNVQ